MKALARSLVVVLVALIAVPALVVTTAVTSAVQLLATTALIMGGTQHPLSPTGDTDAFVNNYFGQALDHYIVPGNDPDEPVATYAVIYPAEFAPVFGTTTFGDSVDDGVTNLGRCLGTTAGSCNFNDSPGVESPDTPPPSAADTHFIVFGYSQSAVVASLVKNQMINDPTTDPDLDGTGFNLVSNPLRPNGGILGRGFEGLTIPFINIPFYGPTQNSCPTADPCAPGDPEVGGNGLVFPTVDVAQQYDFLGGDAPARLSVLAFANSIASYALLHGKMPEQNLADGFDNAGAPIVFQGEYGDTDYYMVTAPRLPLLMLLEQAGVPGPALALPDALLRVWIEDKYRRDLSPGEHVQFQLSPIGNPVALVGNMLGAIPVGIDDTVQQATGQDIRPLGTANVYRPFGVGGPVYDKETGERTTDNVGIPTGAGDYEGAPETLVQNAKAPDTDNKKLTVVKDTNDVISEEESEKTEAPKVTRPRPLQVLRESLNFDPKNRPEATRPGGDGPLRRIVKALTGHKTKPDQSEAKNEPEKDAA